MACRWRLAQFKVFGAWAFVAAWRCGAPGWLDLDLEFFTNGFAKELVFFLLITISGMWPEFFFSPDLCQHSRYLSSLVPALMLVAARPRDDLTPQVARPLKGRVAAGS